MTFKSILDLKESPYKKGDRPSFYLDLNINQIIDRIRVVWGEDVSGMYYYLPADEECETYRREVMRDVKLPELQDSLKDYVKAIKKYKESVATKEVVKLDAQKAAWHVTEVVQYAHALKQLLEVLQKADIRSQGMLALRESLEEYLQGSELVKMVEQAENLQKQMYGFRFKLTYDNNILIVSEDEVPGTYDAFLKESFTEPEKPMKSPYAEDPDLTILEREVLTLLQKKRPAFFKECGAFYKKYKEYVKEEYLQFAQEIVFYLSFYAFENKMRSLGFAFTAPTVDAKQNMFATGLYDLALACVNSVEGKEVTSNDVEYKAEEMFLVVTGPNQGGKTTFARSLGQLVYFAKMGLDVPALAANVHSFSGILTHFSVEESVETGRGKLQEELMRLKPMMEEQCTNAFVVINELFTTAANYDAIIMGQKVLQHFIGRECRGIYVTHLKELTEAHEKVVSMRALLDENGKQNHKIARKEAQDSAYAINQVNKHRLTYEQLKERLS